MQDIGKVGQTVEAHDGGTQSQTTALRPKQALVDRIDDRCDKKQDEE